MDRADGKLDLIATKLETIMVSDEAGRIIRQNDPEESQGPRMLIYGFDSGNVLRLRYDVGARVSAQITRLFATEPTLANGSSKPLHRDEYINLFASVASIKHDVPGVMFLFPEDLHYRHEIELICSGTPEGHRLISGLQADGELPRDLMQLGFREVDEFWEPWCIAMHEDRIASIGFTARLSEHGAESGIVTVPELRGRGFAAAAVSGWAQHPDLRERTLFYSADQTNISSQNVSKRLGLTFIRSSFVIF